MPTIRLAEYASYFRTAQRTSRASAGWLFTCCTPTNVGRCRQMYFHERILETTGAIIMPMTWLHVQTATQGNSIRAASRHIEHRGVGLHQQRCKD